MPLTTHLHLSCLLLTIKVNCPIPSYCACPRPSRIVCLYIYAQHCKCAQSNIHVFRVGSGYARLYSLYPIAYCPTVAIVLSSHFCFFFCKWVSLRPYRVTMERVWITQDHSITSMMMPGGSIIDDVIDATIAKLKLNITCLQVKIWFHGN